MCHALRPNPRARRPLVHLICSSVSKGLLRPLPIAFSFCTSESLLLTETKKNPPPPAAIQVLDPRDRAGNAARDVISVNPLPHVTFLHLGFHGVCSCPLHMFRSVGVISRCFPHTVVVGRFPPVLSTLGTDPGFGRDPVLYAQGQVDPRQILGLVRWERGTGLPCCLHSRTTSRTGWSGRGGGVRLPQGVAGLT